jgi:putative N6-adenine-specific DNA methylase
MAQTYLATIAPGLEDVLLEEVRELGGKRARVLRGGVEFEGTHRVCYGMLLRLRTANGLWLRLDAFRARDRPELYNKARRFGWERVLKADQPFFVRAAAHQSRLIHTGLIAETVGQALVDHFVEDLRQKAPRLADEREQAGQVVLARLDEDRCELSLDGAGELLHRRGWRTRIGPAPLRETLAAAMLRLAGWKPGVPLVDPMCGSGTIVIEAAQLASGVAAGLGRAFAAQQWANFNEALWNELASEAEQARRDAAPMHFGFDLDAGIVDGARLNAAAAGVEGACQFVAGDVADLVPPVDVPGIVVCNPPYGARIAAGDAVAQLLERFARSFAGWKLVMMLPAEQTPRHRGLTLRPLAGFDNGGIAVQVWEGTTRARTR